MHSFWGRANALFAFSFSCLAFVTFACFLSTQLGGPVPKVELRLNHVALSEEVQFIDRARGRRRKSDLADITFDLNADLSDVFNWNTKQIFLYVVAEYKTSKHPVNQVVIWDKIVLRGSVDERLNLFNVASKYPFFDDGQGLLGNDNITLSLHYNLISNAGSLPRLSAGHQRFGFRDQYHPASH